MLLLNRKLVVDQQFDDALDAIETPGAVSEFSPSSFAIDI